MKRQIIALGGGGFSMEPDNHALDRYILSQSASESPKICFIGTASGDSQDYIDRFYECYESKKCAPSHLSLFKGQTKEIRALILEQDIVFVGGGNTRNMLVLWREWKLDMILLEAYQNGVILSGVSAGSMCWFEQGLTDSVPGELNPISCLGILAGSNCPHFDGEPERQEIYKNCILEGRLEAGVACDDGVALHFVNEHLQNVVASGNDVSARIYLRGEGGKLKKEVLQADLVSLQN